MHMGRSRPGHRSSVISAASPNTRRFSARVARVLLVRHVLILFFFVRLNKFDEYNVSSQATAWVKK